MTATADTTLTVKTDTLVEMLGRSTLPVEFVRRTDREKSRGSYTYDIHIHGVCVGQMWKEWHEGAVIARGCVGGSYRGYHIWEIYFEDEDDDDGIRPWFRPYDGGWERQKETRERVERALDKPLEWVKGLYREDADKDETVNQIAVMKEHEVRTWLAWLARKLVAAGAL